MKVQVCVNCKLRKKKCDKGKPSCGYCNSKNLDCQYSGIENERPRVKSKSTLVTDDSIVRTNLLLSTTLSDALLSSPTSIDSAIYLQTLRIIREAGQFVDEISARYFHGIHSFIPIISRSRFHETLVNFGTPPPAAFSTLLLAMCLITHYPEGYSQNRSLIDQSSLYMAAKTMFTQVQSSSPPTLHLIQAGIIIATYEYANSKIDNALATIGICARMGYTARIHLSDPSQKLEDDGYLQAEEEANAWWGIVICERTFFCELEDFNMPFAARFPDSQVPLPKETYLSEENNLSETKECPDIMKSSTSDGGFACIAQAAWLLDQVFKAIELSDIDARLLQLDGLDHTLRTYLTIVIDQAEGRWGRFCTAIAIVIRALFTLHWEILKQASQTTHYRHKSPQEWCRTSCSALDTVVKIVEDIAATQNGHAVSVVDSLPPSRAYVMKAALRHIENSELDGDIWEAPKIQLEASLRQFERRWDVIF